ncbi:hypothetical protein HAT2_00099 [Candidatus Similichlamydia laticola]|uniref:Uncharacterized protein n=1 Tax=Candidatus Similichlamydia laticola TaxID=2170265 RepID=A0A369KAT2_9BACT|nr:hypothetical protein HAT2_00099 [Candidatus Similichlamydia laticola]
MTGFLCLVWIPFDLKADGVLRSRNRSPFVCEYCSWSADCFIQWDIDATAPLNLQPRVIPWREGCFSYRFSEWATFLEWYCFGVRASLTKAKTVFGLSMEPPPDSTQQVVTTDHCFYGTLGCACDFGINFLFNRCFGSDVDLFPFVGVSRLRQGVFFSDVHSIYSALTLSSTQLDRRGTRWPSLFWDCVRVGVATRLQYAQLMLKGECAFSPVVYADTAGMGLDYWDFFGAGSASSYQMGLSYQLSVHFPFHAVEVGLGKAYWSLDADILLPALQTRVGEDGRLIFSAVDQYLRGTLVQTFSGFFVQFNYSF